jgi:hypothetical protein
MQGELPEALIAQCSNRGLCCLASNHHCVVAMQAPTDCKIWHRRVIKVLLAAISMHPCLQAFKGCNKLSVEARYRESYSRKRVSGG